MANKFTAEDLQVLRKMSEPGSVLAYLLMKDNYSPKKFELLISNFPKEYDIVYKEEYEDLPLKIDDPTVNGLLQWRLAIGK